LLSAIFRFFKARTSGNIRCDLARVSNAEKSKKSHSASRLLRINLRLVGSVFRTDDSGEFSFGALTASVSSAVSILDCARLIFAKLRASRPLSLVAEVISIN